MPGRPQLTLVVASALNDVIGLGGIMPWHLPADLAHFRELTTGGTVLMGRKTFESLGNPPRPLPKRRNIVLTRDRSWAADGVETRESLEQALELPEENIFVIGGGNVYEQAFGQADAIEWTRIHAHPTGDTYFRPPLDAFRRVSSSHRPADEKNAFNLDFERWERI